MIRKIYFGIALLSLVFASLACALSEKESLPPQPSGQIIYQSDQYGNTELISINVRSSKTLRLTSNSANDISPAYISTTKQIGFISDRQDGWNLYAMDINGKNPVAITDKTSMLVQDARWSPDGKYIAASLVETCPSTATVCNYDIYVMNKDGTDLKNLTNTQASEWVPEWSPDGQKIAFASDRDGDSEIFIMNQDGSELVQLTHNSRFDGYPCWSPDGSKLAYSAEDEKGNWDIYFMNADGSDPRPLTQSKTGDFAASWSPDGKWLVYVSNNDVDNEIFIIDVNGQNQQRLTNNSYNDMMPIWIP
jgi:TolB protein